MRRKSARNSSVSKASPEKKEEKSPKKTRRQSRRKKQSSTSESDSDDDMKQDIQSAKIIDKGDHEHGDGLKIKISVSTPERVSRRLRNKAVEDEIIQEAEKPTRRSRRRGASPKIEETEEVEEKKGKGKSKGKHKSKLEQSPQVDETEIQSGLSENVQVTAQSPQTDINDVDNIDNLNQTTNDDKTIKDDVRIDEVTSDNTQNDSNQEISQLVNENDDSCNVISNFENVEKLAENSENLQNEESDKNEESLTQTVESEQPVKENENVSKSNDPEEAIENNSSQLHSDEQIIGKTIVNEGIEFKDDAKDVIESISVKENDLVEVSQNKILKNIEEKMEVEQEEKNEVGVSETNEDKVDEKHINEVEEMKCDDDAKGKNEDEVEEKNHDVEEKNDADLKEKVEDKMEEKNDDVEEKDNVSLKEKNNDQVEEEKKVDQVEEKIEDAVVETKRDEVREKNEVEVEEKHAAELGEKKIVEEKAKNEDDNEKSSQQDVINHEFKSTPKVANDESMQIGEENITSKSLQVAEEVSNAAKEIPEETNLKEDIDSNSDLEQSVKKAGKTPVPSSLIALSTVQEIVKTNKEVNKDLHQVDTGSEEMEIEKAQKLNNGNDHQAKEEEIAISKKRVKSIKWGKTNISLNGLSDMLEITLGKINAIYPTLALLNEDDVKLETLTRERKRSSSTRVDAAETIRIERKVSMEMADDVEMKIKSDLDAERASVDNIIAMNRKISIVDDDASKLKPPPSPAKNEKSDVLFITNLVRPFTLKQLKELLERTGNIREDGFWTDRIKSKCYVHYQTEEEAEATRNALHGVHWPIGNGKKLMIDYSTPECLENAKNPPPVVNAIPIADVPEKENQEPDEETKQRSENSFNEAVKESAASGRNVWEIETDKHDDNDIGGSDEKVEKRRYSRSRHSRSPSPDYIKKKQKKADEETIPQRAMDDLFRKTEATPCVYWQPLSPEEIALKQQQRLERMAEHKRRMETQTRKRGSDHTRGAPYRRRY